MVEGYEAGRTLGHGPAEQRRVPASQAFKPTSRKPGAGPARPKGLSHPTFSPNSFRGGRVRPSEGQGF